MQNRNAGAAKRSHTCASNLGDDGRSYVQPSGGHLRGRFRGFEVAMGMTTSRLARSVQLETWSGGRDEQLTASLYFVANTRYRRGGVGSSGQLML